MTSLHRSCILLLVLLGLLSASFGCASPPAKPDSTPDIKSRTAQPDALEPALAIFERYTRYMPADTLFVAILRTDMASRFVEDIFDSPDEEVSQKRLDAMRADFQRLLLSRLGFDPLSADFVMMVASPELQFMVLDGAIKTEFSTQKSIQSQGYQARYIAEDPDMPEDGFWVTLLPDSDAVAVFDSSESFETFAKTATTSSSGLPNTPLAGLYRALFSKIEPAPFSGAIVLDPESKKELANDLSVTAPDALSFHLGEELRVELRGDEQTLKGVQGSVEKFRQEARDATSESYQNRSDDEPFEASLSILAYHLLQHYDEQLDVMRHTDSLVYELPLPDKLLAFSVATSGILGAVFFEYLDRSAESAGQKMLEHHRAEESADEEVPPTVESDDSAPATSDEQ